MLRRLNEGVSFVLELAMLAAFAYFGFTCLADPIPRWLVGLGLPAVAIAVWAILLAPKSRRRLPIVPGLALSTALFLLAALLLSLAGQLVMGVILAAIALLNRVFALGWKQWEGDDSISS